MLGLPTSLTRAVERQGRDLTVLVVRLGAMGDVLRTVPPVRLIRRGLPESRIYWAVEQHWCGVLEGHPDLDGLVPLPRKEWDRLKRRPTGWLPLISSLRRLRRELRELRPDLVVDFHGNLRSGIVGRLSAAAVRLGYAGHQQKEGNAWFSTHRVPSGDRRTPRMERNLDLVRALGLAVEPLPAGELPIVETGRQAAAAITRAGTRSYAVLSPGASRSQAYKKPPVDLLAAACRRLASHGVDALVVYGPGEEEDARRLVERAGDHARLAPPTRVPTLAALLDGAVLFVGGDSGPLHLACAVGCPVLGIYGPTDPRVNQPWGVPYETVFPPGRRYAGIKRIDRQGAGFDGLDGEQVEEALDRLLD